MSSKVEPAFQACVLAGGTSERMGCDKRLLMWRGQTLLDRTIELVRRCTKVSPVLIGDSITSEMAGECAVLSDAVPGRGPLGGLVAGLRWCSAPWLLTLPVDLPRLSCNEIDALLAAAEETLDVVCLGTMAHPQPLVALYHKRSLPVWREQLASEQLAIRKGFPKLHVAFVPPPSGPLALQNLNRPSDLTELDEQMG